MVEKRKLNYEIKIKGMLKKVKIIEEEEGLKILEEKK